MIKNIDILVDDDDQKPLSTGRKSDGHIAADLDDKNSLRASLEEDGIRFEEYNGLAQGDFHEL